LIRALVQSGPRVDASVTEAGGQGAAPRARDRRGERGEKLHARLERRLGREIAAHVAPSDSRAIEAPPSSGTSLTGGAIVCPCSMGTLARISAGFSSNLVERAPTWP
jgi:4-hydroxy-3-polyprenylbenzoate decarboxylase